MICFIMIDHESVLKAGKGAASLNDFACESTPGGTKVWKTQVKYKYLKIVLKHLSEYTLYHTMYVATYPSPVVKCN